ncbi:AbrB/MazE/SpoVT family DNA-binding domain-containing protein [Pseudooceanicola sp.]|uniref:AbrB/MazE/SpoVT family DNA-binding domain-containing protein n=1 Tax=Pseudooceanicola sp. TaxID=1914328 RepID=UPI00260CA2B0|nr:AbrB/MazE/SpoVT family DNA-binding domain-containing protein [Pseudooceanicola sp.]MDF1854245.1 AbrB/MazE/SpoVT family DNA-binding domain-containing protein [Pseudooceanicola sp.]
MTTSTTLSPDFKITLPRDLCARLGWVPGQDFIFLPKPGGVLILPVSSLDELKGIATGASARDFRER